MSSNVFSVGRSQAVISSKNNENHVICLITQYRTQVELMITVLAITV